MMQSYEAVYDKKNDTIVATGVAEFDDEIKEGYPKIRFKYLNNIEQCLGKAIVLLTVDKT